MSSCVKRPSYRRIFAMAVPIILQSSISSCATLVDNLMVGSLGGGVISGVAIAGQIVNVYTYLILGLIAGAGVFNTQFYGANDIVGVQHCFRLRLLLTGGISLVAIPLVWFNATWLIRSFLTAQDDPLVFGQTLCAAREYLLIILFAMPFFALKQSYASTIRESGDVKLPMQAALLGVGINVLFNYLLIYGIGPFPALGARGAALATALSYVTEAIILILASHKKRHSHAFTAGLYRWVSVPKTLFKQIAIKSTPLVLNYFLFGFGSTLLNRCYTTVSADASVAMSVAGTFWNFFSVFFMAFGSVSSILVGHELGARNFEQAKVICRTLMRLIVLLATGVGIVYALAAIPLPTWYSIPPAQQQTARLVMWVQAFFMPAVAFKSFSYETLRAGGMTTATMMIDLGCVWLLKLPIAIILSYTALPLAAVYAIAHSTEFVMDLIGAILLKRGCWLRCVINDTKTKEKTAATLP